MYLYRYKSPPVSFSYELIRFRLGCQAYSRQRRFLQRLLELIIVQPIYNRLIGVKNIFKLCLCEKKKFKIHIIYELVESEKCFDFEQTNATGVAQQLNNYS